jgi:superfamily II DNA or RNA helicase
MNVRTYQPRTVDATLRAIAEGQRRICITAPTGSGKCLGRGTPVLHYSGNITPVEAVQPGDRLMGPDSRPRLVLSTAAGYGQLYRITPVKGKPWVCNDAHILTLIHTQNSNVIDVPIREYLARSKTFRHLHKQFSVGVEFAPAEPLPLDPYFLGVWYGDGTKHLRSIEVSKPDPEIRTLIADTARRFGLQMRERQCGTCPTYGISNVRGRGNPLLTLMRSIIGDGAKIPHRYLTAGAADRAALLAGLLDTDGYLAHAGFEIVQKSPGLADGIAFLARSLGLRVTRAIKTVNGGVYHRLSISGDCSFLPLRIPRKKAPRRRQIKDATRTGFSVTAIDPGEYFGFELDGDGRFLLGDFTVTHNTRIASDLIREFLANDLRTVLYTNRKLLLTQLSDSMAKAGLGHGIRAAGHATDQDAMLQVSSIQTEGSRVLKSEKWQLFDAQRVIVDEAHLQTGMTAIRLVAKHLDAGAAIMGLTATPIGLKDFYDHLIVACTVSEARACGALVEAVHYGPDEPDLKHIGKVPVGEDLTEAQNIKAIMRHGVFARVVDSWRKLNPEGKPTLLFGPGVAESLWFAEQFQAAGIPAAHIDGEDVWLQGELHRADPEIRQRVLDMLKTGDIKICCNRFVLREGIDLPFIEHGIFATVFGSLQSYLQSGGRLLRSFPGKTRAVVQDHGGSWHRFGSLNADREWFLDLTANMATGMRHERIREKREAEPIRCPKCALILVAGRCRGCGFECIGRAKSRPVIQADGTLKEVKGDIFRARRISQSPDAAKIWERMYHRARSKKWNATFRQAEAMFAQENGWQYPPRDLPLMPTCETDWFRKVSEVPIEALIPRG